MLTIAEVNSRLSSGDDLFLSRLFCSVPSFVCSISGGYGLLLQKKSVYDRHSTLENAVEMVPYIHEAYPITSRKIVAVIVGSKGGIEHKLKILLKIKMHGYNVKNNILKLYLDNKQLNMAYNYFKVTYREETWDGHGNVGRRVNGVGSDYMGSKKYKFFISDNTTPVKVSRNTKDLLIFHYIAHLLEYSVSCYTRSYFHLKSVLSIFSRLSLPSTSQMIDLSLRKSILSSLTHRRPLKFYNFQNIFDRRIAELEFPLIYFLSILKKLYILVEDNRLDLRYILLYYKDIGVYRNIEEIESCIEMCIDRKYIKAFVNKKNQCLVFSKEDPFYKNNR